MKAKILVVDDEESIRYTFRSFLADNGHDVLTAGNGHDGLTMIKETDFDLIFMDIILGDSSGIDLLREARKEIPECPVVITTGYPNVETATEALRLGAFEYIFKPVDQEKLIHTVNMALQYKAVRDESERYRSNLEALFNSVKDSIITIDENMVITAANKAAMETFNFLKGHIEKPLKEIMDSHTCKFQPDCICKCLDALMETVRTKEGIEIFRTECIFEDSKKQIITINTSPLIKRHGKFSGAVMVMRDETRIDELEEDLRERRQLHNIIGKNKKMQKIYSLIKDLANVNTNVLITGESGTGKELIADAIHYTGERRSKPLVKVNCSALSETLLESELFGHVRGAFTGADRNKIGRFELADDGTIFLDEIGDISPRMQLRLLRAIQEKEFERVGDSATLKINSRIVAATNQDLQLKVAAGEFREDLYFRLKVVQLSIPPLRERPDDILLLTGHFINKMNTNFNKGIVGVSDEVQRLFLDYRWPGNIRELEHALEHAFVVARQDIITMDMLPGSLIDFSNDITTPPAKEGRPEADIIIDALKRAGWNKSKAARLLNISVRTIYRKIEKYNIKENM